jgi:hypothetical protein
VEGQLRTPSCSAISFARRSRVRAPALGGLAVRSRKLRRGRSGALRLRLGRDPAQEGQTLRLGGGLGLGRRVGRARQLREDAVRLDGAELRDRHQQVVDARRGEPLRRVVEHF